MFISYRPSHDEFTFIPNYIFQPWFLFYNLPFSSNAQAVKCLCHLVPLDLDFHFRL